MREYPHMGDTTRKIMADRLNALMKATPALDTNEKLASKSKVSYGTVRRIRKAEPIDVSIGNVEDVAACFGLSLAEFVSGDLNDQQRIASIYMQLTPARKAAAEQALLGFLALDKAEQAARSARLYDDHNALEQKA